jgi:hypothetical protein
MRESLHYVPSSPDPIQNRWTEQVLAFFLVF